LGEVGLGDLPMAEDLGHIVVHKIDDHQGDESGSANHPRTYQTPDAGRPVQSGASTPATREVTPWTTRPAGTHGATP
jgi:hypothetical protein